MSQDNNGLSPHSCEHNSLIKRQFLRIESLENELIQIRSERDALLEENERLCFQLQSIQVMRTQRVTTDGVHNTIDHHNQRIHSQECQQSRAVVYELSQQLVDNCLSVLERKYGGQRAREAAVTLQRAFRTYRLKKRFKTIAFEALKQRHERQNSDSSLQTALNDSRRQSLREMSSQQSKRLSTSSTNSSLNSSQNNCCLNGFEMSSVVTSQNDDDSSRATVASSVAENLRKRQYRVGLNLFNKNPPERGVQYLLTNGFLDNEPNTEIQNSKIARFLLQRKGISKEMIGEFISNPLNQNILKCFAKEMDFTGLPVDLALRRFQTHFRFPGEAQKIERLVDAFATRYAECNHMTGSQTTDNDTNDSNSDSALTTATSTTARDDVFILSFALIMLNTDLHSFSISSKQRMTAKQWLHNLKHVFRNEHSMFSEQLLLDMYARIHKHELKVGGDHQSQVHKVQQSLVGKDCPNLCVPHRRLVCYCRLYEIKDLNKKEAKGHHQREVFLFNDLLLVTKLSPKTVRGSTARAEYLFRSCHSLDVICVQLFKTFNYMFGIRLSSREGSTQCTDSKGKVIAMFNARNDLDQKRFCEDLKESILEMMEMEMIRRQQHSAQSQNSTTFVKSNSLLTLNNNTVSSDSQRTTVSERQTTATSDEMSLRRKSSSGSLDSGLCLPSRDHSPQQTVCPKK